jgi:hypothetical protein
MPNLVPAGRRRHLVTLDRPGAPVSDGDGGFSQGWVPLDPPTWFCSIDPLPLSEQERRVHQTITASRVVVLAGAWHPGIGIETRVTFGARRFSVSGVEHLDEMPRQTMCYANEVVDAQ